MPVPLRDLTVVFDLDGTLVDTAPDLVASTNHALGLLDLAPVTIDELHPHIGYGSKAMIEAGLRLREKPVSKDELRRLHHAFLDFYAENIAVGSRPFEGIPELIDTLQAAGARLAVCTNKFEGLSKALLQQLGLNARFGAIAGRDTFEVCKPHPGHLTGAVQMAGGDPKRAVMVGDSEVDIATAAAAGVPCIAVTFGYTTVPVRDLKPTAVIDHYREFMGALERVLA